MSGPYRGWKDRVSRKKAEPEPEPEKLPEVFIPVGCHVRSLEKHRYAYQLGYIILYARHPRLIAAGMKQYIAQCVWDEMLSGLTARVRDVYDPHSTRHLGQAIQNVLGRNEIKAALTTADVVDTTWSCEHEIINGGGFSPPVIIGQTEKDKMRARDVRRILNKFTRIK